MSLINDALKQARQAAPDNSPGSLKPLQPVPTQPSHGPSWFLPVVVVVLLLIIGALVIGWVVLRRGGHEETSRSTPPPTVAAAPVRVPVATPPPAVAAPAATPPPVEPPAQPAATTSTWAAPVPPPAPAQVYPPIEFKLQGIDYSPNSPSAILNGKTISPGDMFHQYRVKSISRSAVTLVGPDNRETVIEIGN